MINEMVANALNTKNTKLFSTKIPFSYEIVAKNTFHVDAIRVIEIHE
jgi:hypothetical protein